MRASSAGIAGSRVVAPTLSAGAMDMMLSSRRPWNDYIKFATREDSEVYPTKLNSPPMYRGRKRGMEGWLMKEGVQLHYRRYPDEHIIANLQRWRVGDTVEDLALQQFRGAQPFVLDVEDEQGFKTPDPEEYFKLNYKNPRVISKHLTRTGHYYAQHIQPMNPEALRMLRTAVRTARALGLYPLYGNPFWHRVQRDRPKPYRGEYDPTRAGVKRTLEEFSYNWLQTYRVRQRFQSLTNAASSKRAAGSAGSTERKQQFGYEEGLPSTPFDANVGFSSKTATVPGLMTLRGLKTNPHLYPASTKRRFGFPNPVGTTKKL